MEEHRGGVRVGVPKQRYRAHSRNFGFRSAICICWKYWGKWICRNSFGMAVRFQQAPRTRMVHLRRRFRSYPPAAIPHLLEAAPKWLWLTKLPHPKDQTPPPVRRPGWMHHLRRCRRISSRLMEIAMRRMAVSAALRCEPAWQHGAARPREFLEGMGRKLIGKRELDTTI